MMAGAVLTGDGEPLSGLVEDLAQVPKLGLGDLPGTIPGASSDLSLPQLPSPLKAAQGMLNSSGAGAAVAGSVVAAAVGEGKAPTVTFASDTTGLSVLSTGRDDNGEEAPPPARYGGDAMSTVSTAWEDMSPEAQLEKLNIIRARTMYDLVEDIDEGRKIVFLTSAQADMIAKSPETFDTMLHLLDMPTPKLVINLIQSMGFRNQLNDHYKKEDIGPGGHVAVELPSFPTEEDERLAIEGLERFIGEVLLPLAADTNAVILTNALNCNCILADTLDKMVTLQRARWPGKLPFTILATTGDTAYFYSNPDEEAEWRDVKSQCTAWKMRERKIYELLDTFGFIKRGWIGTHDLLPGMSNYIIVDSVNKKENAIGDQTAYRSFIAELLRHFSSTMGLPSLAIATGGSGVRRAVDYVGMKTPVVFLDVRERPRGTATNRDDVLEHAMDHQRKLLEVLEAETGPYDDKPRQITQRHDMMLNCNLSYFHEALYGDGNPMTTEATLGAENSRDLVALHEAIYRAQASGGGKVKVGTGGVSLEDATPEQLAEVVRFISQASGNGSRFWFTHVISDEKRARIFGSADTTYPGNADAARFIRELLKSPNFNALNVHAPSVVGSQLLRSLVRLDRLPKSNSLEGLLLLHDAWTEYDVSMHLAGWYKRVSKLLFFAELFVGVAVVAVGTTQFSSEVKTDDDMKKAMASWVFGLSLLASVLISFGAVLNAKTRWRQLRSAAGSLEAMIFKYRTRVGVFKMDTSRSDGPEAELCRALVEWRSALVAGADLQNTSLKKESYPAKIFMHFQSALPETIQRRGEAEAAQARLLALRVEVDKAEDVVKASSKREHPRQVMQSDDEAETAAPSEADKASLVRVETELRHAEVRYTDALERTKDARVDYDDFQSPLQPACYIRRRLEPQMEFYRRRIPKYVARRYVMLFIQIACTVAATVVAFLEKTEWAVVVTAVAAAVSSWSEFTDVQRKTERYTQAVTELQNLLSHWRSLSEVDRASAKQISNLVNSAESIISNERVGWVSTQAKSAANEEDDATDGDAGGGGAATKSANSNQVRPA